MTAIRGESPLYVYVIEDNTLIRDNLTATLEELGGISVIGWAAAEEAARDWLACPTSAWDLAIVDLFLEQGSGMGVLAACAERHPNQKIVVLSNFLTSDVRQRCLTLGADVVFDKSDDIEALVAYCEDLRAGRAGTRPSGRPT